MTELRKSMSEAGVTVRVVRNTLLRRAVEGTSYEVLKDAFVGPTLIAFSSEHPALQLVCSKISRKANPAFEIKAAAFEGEFIPGSKH